MLLSASPTYAQLTAVSEALMRASRVRLPRIMLGHTLDLDSTVVCRYGNQEGSQIGYNPQKRGRPSQHPLLAFLSETRRLLWVTLRPGKAGTANGVVELLQQALTMLPAGHQVGVVRADSENRIKELKEDLSLDTFGLQSFEATNAAFRLGCVAYNLLAGFRETVLPRCWFERRRRAVRDLVCLVGADLIPQGRRLQVRLAVPWAERSEFLSRLRTLSEGLPIAAQLEWTLTDEAPPPDAARSATSESSSAPIAGPLAAQPPP